MSSRKSKASKRGGPTASILSYFSQPTEIKVKSEPPSESSRGSRRRNTNNNNGTKLKRKPHEKLSFSSPKRKLNDGITEAIVISSDDEDFESFASAQTKKRKKSSECAKAKHETISPKIYTDPHENSKTCMEKNSDFLTKTGTSNSVDLISEEADKTENVTLKTHSFFRKKLLKTTQKSSENAEKIIATTSKSPKLFPKNGTIEDNLDNEIKFCTIDQNAQNTSHNKSQSSEEEIPQEKIAYYLLNFRQILDTVLGNGDDRSLFEGSDDMTWLDKFNNLRVPGQKLYVRLYHRKLAWLRVEQVNYPDIAEDIQEVLNGLAEEGFLLKFDSSGGSELDLGEILRMMPAASLKELAKSCHVNVNGRPKGQMITDLQEMCKNQQSVLSGFFGKKTQKSSNVKSGLLNNVMKRACRLLGPCYKLAPYPRRVFNRVLLVFDVTRGIDDETDCSLTGSQNAMGQGRHRQLSAILMAGMGKVLYATCEVDRPTPIFRTRSDLLHYETAFQFQSDVMTCVEEGQWKEASELCSAADEVKTELETDDTASCDHSKSLPIFLRCFTAQWTYSRLRSLEVEVLQRLKNYKKAVEILKELLAQHDYCTSRRGHWWERLALNLDQHLKDAKASLDTIHASLQDADVRVGHKLALAQRVNKILTSRAAKKSPELKQLFEDKLQPIIDRLQIEEAPVVEITGRLLPSDRQTGKTRFIATEFDDTDSESTLLCSVEELALSHYRGLGYELGIHGEGGTFSTLFCLFMWDIIFMPGIGDVFRTSYQTHPLDYHTDEFYLRRRDAIEKRLQLIGDMDEKGAATADDNDKRSATDAPGGDESDELDRLSALDFLSLTWDVEYGKACAGLNWERFTSLEEAKGLVKCIGGKVLAGMFRRFAKDLRHTRSGLPDLVVWNPETRIYKMVEVKGPGDRLSTNQKLWLDELLRLDANVEVCKVIAVGGKRLSKD